MKKEDSIGDGKNLKKYLDENGTNLTGSCGNYPFEAAVSSWSGTCWTD